MGEDNFLNNETQTKTLQITIEFIFDLRGTLFMGLDVQWDSAPVDLALADFLKFIRQNEGEMNPGEADFCYAVAKCVKRVEIDSQPRFAIPTDPEMAFLFKRAIEAKVPLHWKRKDGRVQPIQVDAPMPITIKVTQQGRQLVCSLENRQKWIENPLAWLTFQHEKTLYCFCMGVLLENPTQQFHDFIATFLDGPKQRYEAIEVPDFLKTIYEPYKKAIFWQVQADFAALLPQEILPTPILKLSYEDQRLNPVLSFKYGKEKENSKQFIRRVDMESIYQNDLMTLYTEHELPFLLQSPGDIAKFQKVILPILEGRGWKIESHDIPEITVLSDEARIEFSVEASDKDWFHFEPNCIIADQKFSLLEIGRLLVQNQGYLKTKKGYVKVTDKSQQELHLLSQFGAFRPGQGFKKIDILPLIQLSNVIGSNRDASAFIDQAKNLTPVSQALLKKEFSGTLRDYQVHGVNWLNFLCQCGFGGILADDMGLGKTIQALAFSTQIKGDGPVLIVGPTNVIYNWEQEIHKFVPGKKAVVYSGANRSKLAGTLGSADYVITSYGILKNDLEVLGGLKVRALYIDEAQYIKNPKAQISQAVKALISPFKLAMTGTPVENHLDDLWNLFDFAMPGYLGTQGLFDATPKEKLKARIAPFVLRRIKKEVLDSLPEKTEMILTVPLYEEQEKLYKTILDLARKGIRNAKGMVDRMNVLTSLLKLRQVCIHPGLIKEFEPMNLQAAKMDTAKETITELIDENHKIVLFTQFTGVLDMLESWSKENKFYYERIDGSVTGKNRAEAVRRFQETEKAGLFMISLKAGGIGINLTAADYVIHLDPWWNPAVESQATDRVHRMGQKNKVMVYKLIAQGTIEEKIQQLQETKRQLLGEIIDIDSIDEKKIDFEEIRNLLIS